jgi:hypothetical protein
MSDLQNKLPINWENVIFRGVESDQLDYKSAMNWTKMTRAAKAKIVRHCLAMGNTKGGYLVIGVGEDDSGHPSVYTGLTREEAHSFDPSAVGQFVNRHVEPPIDFTVERPTVDGKRYAVFVIRPFASLPHVCANGVEGELLQGVFYIRTTDASSRPATRAVELQGLIQRALRNQRELLGRMLRGILYENRNPAEADASRFEDDIATTRNYFLHRHPVAGNKVRIELTAALPDYDPEHFGFPDVRHAVESACMNFPDGVFLNAEALTEAYCTNTALRIVHKTGGEMCQIGKSGLFYFTRELKLVNRRIEYLELIKLFAEIIHFVSRLYANLGLDEQLITIRTLVTGTDQLTLSPLEASPAAARKRARRDDAEGKTAVCHISEIKIELRRTAADLASGREMHAARLIREIAERFNAPEIRERQLADLIRDYLEKR